ncbi:MAG: ABC transporter permease [Spirochaetae bacterium HGW-Spirochaetae-8]|nr:MAG: ABC transporter permease [Spirochaetae bacterium HGW-Spirochaetae-8]
MGSRRFHKESTMDIVLVFGVLIILILAGVPVAFSMGLSALAAFAINGTLNLIPVLSQRIYSGSTSFVLLAIPFYIMSGLLMNGGGMSSVLFKASDVLVGRIPGGLGHVNILVSMLFAGMSGSSVADATGVGVVEMEMMEKAGFDTKFAASVTAASATIGPIIPPSIPFVVYGAISGVSVGKLFLGGMVPGLAMALAMMVTVYIIAIRRNYPRSQNRYGFVEGLLTLLKAIVPMGSFILIIGGISMGIFTPTEAAIVASLYALLIGTFVYRELNLKILKSVVVETVRNTIRVVFIMAMAAAYAYALTIMRVPQRLTIALATVAGTPWLFLLVTNALLLLLGCFMETISTITLVTPILLPIAMRIGIDPIHFGIMMTLNLMIGQLTPPVGILLYSVASMTKLSMRDLLSELWPYIVALFVVLILVTYIPSIVMFVPNLLM